MGKKKVICINVLLIFCFACIQSYAGNNNFIRHIPNPKELLWKSTDQIHELLTNMGYEGNYKFSDGNNLEPYMEMGSYHYKVSDKSVLISFKREEDGGFYFSLEVTIKGDAEALRQYYKQAMKLKEKGKTWQTEVIKEGDKVVITSGGD